jgi:hypothetical protein
MKRILALTFLFVTTVAHAEWTKVQVTDHGKYGTSTDYIDLDSMMKLPNDSFQVWVLYSHDKPQKVYLENGKETQSLSLMSLMKYDCKKQTASPLRGKSYSERMGKGNLVETFDFTKEDMGGLNNAIEPNTVHMAVWKKYCK